MPYIKETCKAGRTFEVCKYHSSRYGKRGQRGARRAESSDAMQAANCRRAQKELRRLMNANFEDGKDAFVTLSWRRGEAPAGTREAMKAVRLFVRGLARDYKRAKKPLKYIYTLEIGPKGSRHAHFLISGADLAQLVRRWRCGAVNVVPLHSGGQYAKIADYFVKYAKKTEKTEGRKMGRRFCTSKNLVRPVPKKVIVQACTFSERIRPRAGYYLDKESVRGGVCEITGQPFLQYTYIMDAAQELPERKAAGRKRADRKRSREQAKQAAAQDEGAQKQDAGELNRKAGERMTQKRDAAGSRQGHRPRAEKKRFNNPIGDR